THVAYGARELCFGLVERDLCIGLVELYQRLSRLDELRVVGANRDHDAGNLRRDLHDVTVDVCVVGRLQIAQDDGPVRTIGDADRNEREGDDGQPAFAL